MKSVFSKIKKLAIGDDVEENIDENNYADLTSDNIAVPHSSYNEVVSEITPGELYSIDTIAPQQYDRDASKIGKSYMEGKTVFLNLAKCPEEITQRIIDFSSGLALAYGGKLIPNDDAIFLLIHPNVEVNSLDGAN